ncbi:hypothetical protein Ancab_034055 [Ancistrocladus abbreviatus]
MNRGINAEKNSKPPENNDKRVSNSSSVGQSHRVQYVRRETDKIHQWNYYEAGTCRPLGSGPKSQDYSQKLDSSLGNLCAVGPSLLWPKQELGGKERSLSKDWAMESGTAGPSDVLCCNRPLSEKAEHPEISGMSLSDSHIENMNRLFLLKFDNVLPEETWEVGKSLGVQSVEGDVAVIQRIREVQG